MTAAVDEMELVATPYGFAKAVLGMNLYPWQCDALAALDQRGSSVALKAANGSGKSSTVGAAAAIWNAAIFPGSLTIVTSGVYRQVKEQFFPAIRAHNSRFPDWSFLETEVETPTGSRIIGFSTDDPGRFEGWHNDNLLMICDEAKSIPNPIFDSIDRCQPVRLLFMSSPGTASGRFYDAFTRQRQFYTTISATAYDCPHLSEEWINREISKHGITSPLIRSMIFAEFQKDGQDGTLISLRNLEECLAQPPEWQEGKVHAFCDFAAGGDENVLAVRRGNRVEVVKAWRERNTMAAVGEFIRSFREQDLHANEISGDGSGLGKPICDRLKEEGWAIRPVNNGARASEPDLYVDVAAETWAKGARTIEEREVILPDDDLLHAQLTSRKSTLNSRGQIQLESKTQMRNRGMPSPDRADAVLGCLYEPVKQRIFIA